MALKGFVRPYVCIRMNKKTLAVAILSLSLTIAPLAASALTVDDIQAQIKSLLSRIAELQLQVKATASAPASSVAVSAASPSKYRICAILNRNLSRGAQGDDVRGLQEFLTAEGYLSTNATGYFGPATAQAVAAWQSSQGISAVGAMGPVSRARMRAWCNLPTSAFQATPDAGVAPLAVDFTYTPATDDGTQYYIEFGDGAGQRMDTRQIYCIRAPCISPSVAAHTYGAPGIYTATVSQYIACLYTNPRCMLAQPPPLGSLTIRVFAVGTNQPPVISSFSGPTTLALNAVGTWTITASDPENGPLSYNVWWGDENVYAPAMSSATAAREFVQTTTFTHAYAYAGVYTVTIVVRDSSGQEAKSSSTVQVGRAPVACTLQYDPVCGRPAGCMNTCPPGMYCAMMCQLYPAQTYGNRCALDASGAEFLYSGQCTSAQ